jgi:DNA processing protein
MNDLRYWIGFNIVRGIGPTRLRALLDYFGDVERAWHAPVEGLRRTGLDSRSLKNLLAARSTLDLERELERIAATGARVLTWESPDYPRLLREIPAPPWLSSARGGPRPADGR